MNLWNCTDFDVIVQDVDQPAFAYPPSPSSSPTTILHSFAND